MTARETAISRWLATAAVCCCLVGCIHTPPPTRTMEMPEALKIALRQVRNDRIVQGNYEVTIRQSSAEGWTFQFTRLPAGPDFYRIIWVKNDGTTEILH